MKQVRTTLVSVLSVVFSERRARGTAVE